MTIFDYSHGRRGELVLGEIERVIRDRDAVLMWILSCGQISSKDAVAGHTEKGHNAMPCLVVEPHLPWRRQSFLMKTAC